MNSKKLMVKPGKKVNLADHDPDDTHGLTKAMADRQLEKHRAKLDQLQELLYAGKQHSLLIVVASNGRRRQGRHHPPCDGGGESAKLSRRFVQGATELELGHDFLWRVHKGCSH